MRTLKYLIIAALLAASALHVAAAEDTKSRIDAVAVIARWQKVAVDAKARQATPSELAQGLGRAAQEAVASRAMAAALLGSPWGRLTEQEKADLAQLVGKLFARTVAGALRGPTEPSGHIADTQLKSFASKPRNVLLAAVCAELFTTPCSGFTAETSWKSSSGTGVVIDYLVFMSNDDNKWHIVNATFNGGDFLQMYRGQFKDMFEAGGIANVLVRLNGLLARPLE